MEIQYNEHVQLLLDVDHLKTEVQDLRKLVDLLLDSNKTANDTIIKLQELCQTQQTVLNSHHELMKSMVGVLQVKKNVV
jgi:hypothetical protein